MDISENAKKIYIYINRKVTGDRNFIINSNKRNDTYLQSFERDLGKFYDIDSIGLQFLIEYFIFQFQYWHDKETKRKMTLNWVTGEKAIKRWIDRVEYYRIFNRDFLKKYGILIDDLLSLCSNYNRKLKINHHEEVEKLRFSGTKRLVHCLEFTSLFHPLSKTCISCKYSEECRELQKTNYPAIYRNRKKSVQEITCNN